jgi:prophage DNA circulation protein
MRDYTIARDQLVDRLEEGGAGQLQLPMMAPMMVACSRYRLTEEDRYGGYCVFDMSFVEQGASPFTPIVDPTEQLIQKSMELRQTVLDGITLSRVSPAVRMQLLARIASGAPISPGS